MKRDDYAAALTRRAEALGWTAHYKGGPWVAYPKWGSGQGWLRVQLIYSPAISWSEWIDPKYPALVQQWVRELGEGPLDPEPPVRQPDPPPKYRSEWE